MDRRTERRIPIGTAPDAWLRSVRRIASEVRVMGAGAQADDLDVLAERLQTALTPPRLRGVLAGLRHPQAWPTREHGLWLAERLQEGARIVTALVMQSDAEPRAELAKRALQWVEALGLTEDPAERRAKPP